ncbi:hypothetical protein [Spirosoma foliorum]|uniref:Uncharacterized protein n=1 Tax=Spirosoma foliorum TaxID=2710596 RepID=A0A7G5H2M2_9BACT|nr:hypothetical protein [Spirosoma foliorum]QMW05364.1 hypothetical protein H3H32_10965 [Spirosoma foliorum]
MTATLYTDSKPAYVSFDAAKLPSLLEKYGERLRVHHSDVPLAPAAESRATVQTWQGEPTKKTVKPKPKPVQALAPKKEVSTSPVVAKKPRAPRPQRAVIRLPDLTFYPNSGEAAAAIEVERSMIGKVIRGERPGAKGHYFRYATDAEAIVGKALPGVDNTPKLVRRSIPPTAKPVVNLTTGAYYVSAMQASKDIDCHVATLCHFLNKRVKPRKTNRRLKVKKQRTVRGFLFRYATEEEIKVGHYIPQAERLG